MEAMSRAITVREVGGADVLRLEDHDPCPTGSPEDGTLLVRVAACGDPVKAQVGCRELGRGGSLPEAFGPWPEGHG